jgi:predicted DNA-binding transcriptional regulator YafY
MQSIDEERTILTPEEFRAEQAAGWFNPESSYDDYLAMIRAQWELRRDAEEKARREGYELGAPQIELTPEDEAILDRVWAKRAAEKAAAEAAEKAVDEDEQLTPARAA